MKPYSGRSAQSRAAPLGESCSPPTRRRFPGRARLASRRLVARTWERLEAHIRCGRRSASIVALHDATPLARYTGGLELLARLAVAAGHAAESPSWPVAASARCEDPQDSPQLDGLTVSVIPGDAEQLSSRKASAVVIAAGGKAEAS